MDVALLVNPAARSGARSDAADRAAARLRAAGIRVGVVSGGSAADSSALLRAALEVGTDAVLVAGGDGTVNLAIQELIGTRVPLGVIPVGTGNDLAAAVGLRELRPEAAADAVIAGRTQIIDLARMRDANGGVRHYATVLASGFDAKVNDRANAMRWPRGHLRYDLAVLVEFLRLRDLPFRVELETAEGDVEVFDGPLLMASVGNGPSYGGGIPICPDARLDDGLLDVTLVHPASRSALLRLMPTVYRGTHADSPLVTTRRARAVELSSPESTAYADGDPVGRLPVRIEAVPAALPVFTADTGR